MGIRGVRRGNTAKQIQTQIKTAAECLLAVMNLLQREQPSLSPEVTSNLDAIGRRVEWIKEKLKNSASTKGKEGS